MRKQQPEYELQKQVCQYLSLQYPDVLFLSDTGSGVKLTMPQAIRNKQIQKNGFKCPDLMIFAARHGHHGLMIELKAETPFKKDGTLKKNEHLEAQDASLWQLKNKGYYAQFAYDFDGTTELIDWYLSEVK